MSLTISSLPPKRRFGAQLAGSLLLLLLGLLVSFPFLWMIRTSFLKETDAPKFPPIWIPDYFSLDNYIGTLTLQPFALYLGNSLLIALTAVVTQLLTASLGAYAFARLRFPGRDKLFLLYLGTMLIPGQVTMIPSYVLISRFGWIDSYMGLIVPGMFNVFITFLLRQFFLSIPMELEDAAKIDGASYLRIYATIIMPLAKPALATAAIFIFTGSWGSFLWPLLLIRTRELRTVPLGLAAMQLEQGHTNIPQLMAGSTMAIVPIILIFLLLQRYYIEGITLTGVKG
ncbi:MAG: carbohydrate ABC transporter permease [Caldilineaceae bacterium]|nr:carbohydrate ABC transporter permease [Caldilineaceae bacterium]